MEQCSANSTQPPLGSSWPCRMNCVFLGELMSLPFATPACDLKLEAQDRRVATLAQCQLTLDEQRGSSMSQER